MRSRPLELAGALAVAAVFGPEWAAAEDLVLLDASDVTLALALVCLPVGWLLGCVHVMSSMPVPGTPVPRRPHLRAAAAPRSRRAGRLTRRRGPPRLSAA
jgi:hypothetical protein